MIKIFEDRFAQWIQGKKLAEAITCVYENIRDIPYAVIPELNSCENYVEILTRGRGSCMPKHLLLGNMYEKLGLQVLYSVFPFRWDQAEINYPPDLREMATKLPPAHHLACRVNINDRFVLVDATLDPGLDKLALPVNTTWDGISDTLLPIIPTGDEQLYDSSEAQFVKTANHGKEAIEFYNRLNAWLEEVRTS